MNGRPVIVVHGGAGALPGAEDRALYLEGVRQALEAGCTALARSARDAVRAAVMHLESHTITNAGRGAALATDGTAALDAGFMDGATRRFGGVTGVRATENPILLAEHLAGDGDFGRFVGPPCADGLVEAAGARRCDPRWLVTERAAAIFRQRSARRDAAAGRWLDTVGAVALDGTGHVAAAVSTGGMSLKRPGRIGDSPVVGGGYYADDRLGACVTTGVGEVLMRQGTARQALALLAAGRPPGQAATLALAELLDGPEDLRGRSGLILVSAAGEVALAHSTPEMSAGWMSPGGRPEVGHLWQAGP